MNNSFGRLSKEWESVDEIVAYGVGNIFQTYFDEIIKRVRICFIIDNSLPLKKTNYNGIPIFSLVDAMCLLDRKKIIIMAETISYGEIRESLLERGFVENKDFTSLERFVCEWGYRHLHKTELLEVHVPVTTRCTFRCKKCNMFIPYYDNGIQYSFKELKKNIDLLFRHIDSVYKFQIVGGEPFINEDLSDYIEYVNKIYRPRIARFRLITNGSVMPSNKMLKMLKQSRCEVYLSDYRNAIKYSENFKKVLTCLQENEIKHAIVPSLRWRDVGFPDKPCDFSKDNIRNHMIMCGTSWHGLVDNRLYYCNTAWSAEKCGLFKNEEYDFIDLKVLPQDRSSKEKIISLCLGDNGEYNSFCHVCGGCGKDNNKFVNAGEQC